MARPEPVEGPTHAGGVVVRHDGDRPRYLLVTARNQQSEWVFPKGHIEKHESLEEAAAREVLEEAGVTATVGDAVGDLEYRNKNGKIRVRFFLMEFQSEAEPAERRSRAWLSAEEARARLRHEDAKGLIDKAQRQT